jgi:hypothetical protein
MKHSMLDYFAPQAMPESTNLNVPRPDFSLAALREPVHLALLYPDLFFFGKPAKRITGVRSSLVPA